MEEEEITDSITEEEEGDSGGGAWSEAAGARSGAV